MIRDHLYEVLMVPALSLLTTIQRMLSPTHTAPASGARQRFTLLFCLLVGSPIVLAADELESVAGDDETGSGRTSDEAGQAARAMLAEYWLPREQLSAARRRGLPDWCEGGYKSVPQPHPAGVDPATLPVQAEANEATYFIDERLLLSGNVEITRGNRTLRTESAVLFEDSERAELAGNVRLEEPGLVLLGEGADVDLVSESAKLGDVAFLLTDASLRGEAASVSQSEDGQLLIEDGSVTRCDPGSNMWSINSRSIAVDDGAAWGTARHAVVRVKDVPIFYLPYMRFPVSDERQSGWLFPNIGYSSEDGFMLGVPYYLNIAPDWDATLTPRVWSKRGFGAEGELRHLNRYGSYELGAAYLPKDRLFNGVFDKDDFFDVNPNGDFDPADRWLLSGEHSGGLTGALGRLDTVVDYTAVSDPDYFRDLGTGLSVSSRVELERRAAVRYRAGERSRGLGEIDTQLWVQRFQRLDELNTDAYQRLPQLDLSYARNLLGPAEFRLTSQFTSFDRNNDDLTGLSRIVGERFHVQPELRLPLQWPYAFAEVAGGLRYTSYDLRDVAVGVDDQPDRSIAYASADGGLFFERNISLFGKSMIQTLEPRLYYLYQEREQQSQLPLFDVTQLRFSYSQLFRRNRFSGLDRISDANQFSAGVSSAFVDAKSGREFFRASIGQIFYLRDRLVAPGGALEDDNFHSTSAIAAEARATISRYYRVNSTVIWDPNDNTVDESLFHLGYRKNNRRIANIGYRKQRLGNLKQTDLSLLWGLSKRWSVLGRWNYDLVSNRTIEGFVGLEYNDCCWKMRLIARRFIENRSAALIQQVEPDKGIFFQFVFKGLAGFGANIDTLMQRGIRGYRPDESNRF